MLQRDYQIIVNYFTTKYFVIKFLGNGTILSFQKRVCGGFYDRFRELRQQNWIL